MGRTNYAILAMGFASVLVLSMLMKAFLQAAEGHKRLPLLDEITATFGERLEARTAVHLETIDDDRWRAVVTIHPHLGVGEERLSTEIGEFVWRRLNGTKPLDAVEVVCHSWAREDPMTFQVAQPYISRPSGPHGLVPGTRPAKEGPAGATPKQAPTTSRPAAPAPAGTSPAVPTPATPRPAQPAPAAPTPGQATTPPAPPRPKR
ncbi:MAG: hypothetical protein AAF628_16555 [Planctomycetota bacterium]